MEEIGRFITSRLSGGSCEVNTIVRGRQIWLMKLTVEDVADCFLKIVPAACSCQRTCVSNGCYLLAHAAMPLAGVAPCRNTRVRTRSELCFDRRCQSKESHTRWAI